MVPINHQHAVDGLPPCPHTIHILHPLKQQPSNLIVVVSNRNSSGFLSHSIITITIVIIIIMIIIEIITFIMIMIMMMIIIAITMTMTMTIIIMIMIMITPTTTTTTTITIIMLNYNDKSFKSHPSTCLCSPIPLKISKITYDLHLCVLHVNSSIINITNVFH